MYQNLFLIFYGTLMLATICVGYAMLQDRHRLWVIKTRTGILRWGFTAAHLIGVLAWLALEIAFFWLYLHWKAVAYLCLVEMLLWVVFYCYVLPCLKHDRAIVLRQPRAPLGV